MSLIDTDALKDCVEKSIAEFGGLYSEDLKTGLRMCVYIAEQQPERIRWKWVRGIGEYAKKLMECSECSRTFYYNAEWNFCPNCGADMREASND